MFPYGIEMAAPGWQRKIAPVALFIAILNASVSAVGQDRACTPAEAQRAETEAETPRNRVRFTGHSVFIGGVTTVPSLKVTASPWLEFSLITGTR